VQIELNGKTAIVQAFLVPDWFFSKADGMILSRHASARLRYRLIVDYEKLCG
jgi:hypothetical protein